MSVVFVEHDMDVVRHQRLESSSPGQKGRIIAEGPPDAVMANEDVIDAYLGAHHDKALTPIPGNAVLPGAGSGRP